MKLMWCCAFLGLLLSLCAPSPTARAHEIRPALLDISETAPGVFDVTWKLPGRGDRALGLEPILPANPMKSCAMMARVAKPRVSAAAIEAASMIPIAATMFSRRSGFRRSSKPRPSIIVPDISLRNRPSDSESFRDPSVQTNTPTMISSGTTYTTLYKAR